MKPKILYVAIFVAGLSLGALAEYGLTHLPETQSEKDWKSKFNEEGIHARMLEYQCEVEKLGTSGAPKDAQIVLQQIQAHSQIEDLLIKSRQAEFAKFTPFSTIFAAITAALGSLVTWFFTKRTPRGDPDH